MYIILDENNFINTVAWGGVLKDGFEVEDFEFVEDMRAYKYVDDEIVLDYDRLQQLQNEQFAQEEVQKLQEFLISTDYFALQWLEEDKLDIPHHRSSQEYKETMQKRQEARTKIRALKEKI